MRVHIWLRNRFATASNFFCFTALTTFAQWELCYFHYSPIASPAGRSATISALLMQRNTSQRLSAINCHQQAWNMETLWLRVHRESRCDGQRTGEWRLRKNTSCVIYRTATVGPHQGYVYRDHVPHLFSGQTMITGAAYLNRHDMALL